MTYKISLEALGQLGPDGFAKLVTDHIAALKEYDAHLVLVRRDAEIADLPDAERHIAFPPPWAHAEVVSAIRVIPRDDGTSDFVPDYEIAGPTLEQKKAKLFDQVSAAEREAIASILPSGKVRLYQFRHADIMAIKEEERSVADNQFLSEQAVRDTTYNKVVRWAAQLHSDIEDLTAETIDAWKLEPFHD